MPCTVLNNWCMRSLRSYTISGGSGAGRLDATYDIRLFLFAKPESSSDESESDFMLNLSNPNTR
eukprot:6161747-Pyramimonas_sp.AAC.2